MFDDVLAYFDDFPQVTIEFYSESETYDPATGQTTVEWTSEGEVSAWGMQQSAVRSYINDRMFDDVDMIFIMEASDAPDAGEYLKYDGNWYTVHYPDNVGFADSVTTIGVKRVTAPVEGS